jgi:TrmH family RNA methyltransferase
MPFSPFSRETGLAVISPRTETLSALGAFKSNNAALAIVRIPEVTKLPTRDDQIILALDNINDPGNLGTIIRIADWYNIKYILINHSSVDIYNPKVVSASKGSLTRVNVIAHNLIDYLREYKGEIYSAELSGVPISKVRNIASGIILMGSESHGVSAELEEYITKKVTIPKKGGAESLNVAVATGIVCNELLTG